MGFNRKATVSDAIFIANNLREADRQECDALLALPPEMVLPQIVASGRRALTGVSDAGEPTALWGVDPVQGTDLVGTIWMVGTPNIARKPKEFLPVARQAVNELNAEFPILTNLADARNVLHHRWLKSLGFVFLRRIEQWGARSVPFIEFARFKPCAWQ